MSYIDKQATLDAIAQKAKADLADANHYYLEGIQLAMDVVEGMEEADMVARPDKEQLQAYLYWIYERISPHTSAESVVAIKYYMTQIYEAVMGEEGPEWMA